MSIFGHLKESRKTFEPFFWNCVKQNRKHKIVNTQMHATERTFLWGKGGYTSIGSVTTDDDDDDDEGSENIAKTIIWVLSNYIAPVWTRSIC